MASDYIKALDALRFRGSLAAAAEDIGISKQALVNTLRSRKIEPYDFTDGHVVGRNAGLRRTLLNGRSMSIAKPIAPQIDIEDISRGLARTCYNNGQTTNYFSLAFVSGELAGYVLSETGSTKMAFMAFMYYAHTAYLGYVHHSIRGKLTGNWKNFVRDMNRAIYDSEVMYLDYLDNKEELEKLVVQFEKIADLNSSSQESDWFETFSSARVDEPRFIRNYASLKSLIEAT